jgi:hypothetical protein
MLRIRNHYSLRASTRYSTVRTALHADYYSFSFSRKSSLSNHNCYFRIEYQVYTSKYSSHHGRYASHPTFLMLTYLQLTLSI